MLQRGLTYAVLESLVALPLHEDKLTGEVRVLPPGTHFEFRASDPDGMATIVVGGDQYMAAAIALEQRSLKAAR